jgi:hypothetical protein
LTHARATVASGSFQLPKVGLRKARQQREKGQAMAAFHKEFHIGSDRVDTEVNLYVKPDGEVTLTFDTIILNGGSRGITLDMSPEDAQELAWAMATAVHHAWDNERSQQTFKHPVPPTR